MNIQLDNIRFVLEVPIRDLSSKATIRHEFDSFAELQKAYNDVLRAYHAQDGVQLSLSDTSTGQNMSVNGRRSIGSKYLIQYSLLTTDRKLLKKTFRFVDSYEWLTQISSYPIYHYFIGDNKYYLFNDPELQDQYLDYVNKPDQLENIKSILYRSEYIDITDLGLCKKQDEFFDDVPINFIVDIDVWDIAENKLIVHWSKYNEGAQLFNSYNLSFRLNYTDGSKETVKMIQHVYPFYIERAPVSISVTNGKDTFYFLNKRVINPVTAYIGVGSIPLSKLLSDENQVEVVRRMSRMDSIKSIEFIWKNNVEIYNQYTIPKTDNSSRKLSDSIHDNYVDRIEDQLRAYLIPTSEPITVEFAKETVNTRSESYTPHWVSFYHPKIVRKDGVYHIIPRHNHQPSICPVDRVLYDYQSPHKMHKPIYWNEQQSAWTSTDVNRDYLVSIFGNNIEEITTREPETENKKKGRRTISREVNNDEVNTEFKPRRSTRLAGKSN
jgi:hypothetical protein